ncbi:MAG: DUF2019 domain-containing protein [Deltaproteobacteria bacterium]|jgi:hypothetical protein|nr:DUF2019 domain-containing protein [Deltaproteobacteria bacterium]
MTDPPRTRPYRHKDLQKQAAKKPRKPEKREARPPREVSLEARRRREERLRRLAEYASPERQRIEVDPSDRLTRFRPWSFSIVFSGIMVAILGLFALIAVAQGRNQLGIEVSRLNREHQRLSEVNTRLKARIEELVVLEDLEVIARESLRLRIPQKGQIVEID